MIIILISFPQVNADSRNSGLVWGINEGETLDYQLSYTEFSYNTMRYYVKESIALHASILDLPDIGDSILNVDDIPLVQTRLYFENWSQTALQDIVWIPNWYMSWQPLYLILPIGNFDLLRGIVMSVSIPNDFDVNWYTNNTEISSGYSADIEGLGFIAQILKTYSNSDGGLLEFSFVYDDLFVRSSFNFTRNNLQEIVYIHTLQQLILLGSFIGGCILISTILISKYLRVRSSVHQVHSRMWANTIF